MNIRWRYSLLAGLSCLLLPSATQAQTSYNLGAFNSGLTTPFYSQSGGRGSSGFGTNGIGTYGAAPFNSEKHGVLGDYSQGLSAPRDIDFGYPDTGYGASTLSPSSPLYYNGLNTRSYRSYYRHGASGVRSYPYYAGGFSNFRTMPSTLPVRTQQNPQNLPPQSAPSGQPQTTRTAQVNSVQLQVRLPAADATVWVEDTRTQQRGLVRHYFSPPLERGQEFKYHVKARWVKDGKSQEQTRVVPVEAGERVTVDFTQPAAATESSREERPRPFPAVNPAAAALPANPPLERNNPNSPRPEVLPSTRTLEHD